MPVKSLGTMLGFTLLIVGCSSVPSDIRGPVSDVTVQQAQEEPDAHLGEEVRWGGEIAGVENRDGVTWIEIVGKPLDRKGRPEKINGSDGRFVARVDDFLDPVVYRDGRIVTVYGTFERIAEGRVGGQPYQYPIVQTQSVYLWDEED